jgi:hypothetical protein
MRFTYLGLGVLAAGLVHGRSAQADPLASGPAAVRDFQVSKRNDITIMICAGGVYQFQAATLTEGSFDKLLDDLGKLVKDRIAEVCRKPLAKSGILAKIHQSTRRCFRRGG